MDLKLLFIGLSKERCGGIVEPGTTLETRFFGSGEIPHVEHAFYAHIAAHNVIEMAVAAERDGFDAVVIGCYFDPGLREARELVSIPVVGVGEATLHVASMLCAGRFSVVVGRRSWIPRMADNARNYGIESKIGSWRVLDLSVRDMGDPEKAGPALLREARLAVQQDQAEAICVGCTAMAGLTKAVQDELHVPVLDPAVVGLKVAELQATLWRRFGISHSKAGGYETPPPEECAKVYRGAYGVVSRLARVVSAAVICRF